MSSCGWQGTARATSVSASRSALESARRSMKTVLCRGLLLLLSLLLLLQRRRRTTDDGRRTTDDDDDDDNDNDNDDYNGYNHYDDDDVVRRLTSQMSHGCSENPARAWSWYDNEQPARQLGPLKELRV